MKCKECVRVIIYSEEVMRRYNVGKVVGYDDQEIEIPGRNIVHESFFLIARRKDEDGYIYDFVRPEKKGNGALYYHLLEGEGKIIIEDPGDFIDADLFMGSMAITMGSRGNISPGSDVQIERKDVPQGFYNPGAGTGGSFRETLDEVKDRFVSDMRVPYRAVTAGDYEEIVKTTPGLCIRKARAFTESDNNMIKVVVMPDSDEKFPKLSRIYTQKIEERIKARRLLTSQFAVIKPAYAAVGVKCTVYVKRHFTDCRAQIEERIRSRVDYINTEHNFGERLRFEDVFYA
ncbi:MAG: baseplate J/gp47 family protein, partial [Lachnospiraceae bacterium]|nr:baseplate J/gp47 family protein [Lachnospiraceae bacterium]